MSSAVYDVKRTHVLSALEDAVLQVNAVAPYNRNLCASNPICSLLVVEVGVTFVYEVDGTEVSEGQILHTFS